MDRLLPPGLPGPAPVAAAAGIEAFSVWLFTLNAAAAAAARMAKRPSAQDPSTYIYHSR